VFSNTVGYAILDTVYGGMDAVMKTYIDVKTDFHDDLFDLGFLINIFDVDNYQEVRTELEKEGERDRKFANLAWKKHDENKLKSIVVQKHTIGHICWIYLAALAATTISYKFMVRDG